MAGLASHRIHLFLHGLAGNNVTEFYCSIDLGDNRGGKRIPGGQQITRFDFSTIFYLNVGAVNDRKGLQLTAGLADNGELASPAVHHDQLTVRILGHVKVDVLDRAIRTRTNIRLLYAPAGSTADVKRTHGQLGTGFADRLGCQNPNRLTNFHQAAVRQVAAVTFAAHP